MKNFFIVVCCLVVLVFVISLTSKPNKELDDARAFSDQVDAQCEKMMSDSALGAERRQTRDICDRLHEEAARRLTAARH